MPATASGRLWVKKLGPVCESKLSVILAGVLSASYWILVERLPWSE